MYIFFCFFFCFLVLYFFFFFFFFQAEDGIRDDLVTGVQTCALPISSESRCIFPSKVCNCRPSTERCICSRMPTTRKSFAKKNRTCRRSRPLPEKIGRASCRERV